MARILIVDDSPTDVKVLTDILVRAGHQVSSSATAEDGVDCAKKTLPDLVLMDIIMPGMNGFQATRALSRDPLTSEIPVVIVTTKGMETDRVWGIRQGAKDFLVKPVQSKELIDRIQKLLAR